jgi:outer membrane usher protein
MIRRLVCLLWGVSFLTLCLNLPWALSSEKVILRVILNGQPRGDFILTLTADGDILLRKADLSQIGLRLTESESIFAEEVSLRSIKGLSFRIDPEEVTLYIEADPHLLVPTRMSLHRERPFKAEYLKTNAFYTNYSISWHADDRFSKGSLRGAFETVLRAGEPLFYSNFSYVHSSTEDRLVRMLTSVTIDRVDTLHRLVIGDFQATSGGLGSAGTFGGIKIEKTFLLKPYLLRYPGLGVEGVLDSPSTVEIYVNDSLVEKLDLPPGEFYLSDLPVTPGAGEIRLIIRDAYGRERIIKRPFYIPSRLLRPGLSEYSLSLGFRREDLGEKSFHYSRLSGLGFYRRGLTEWCTAGIRAEADSETFNLGVTSVILALNTAEVNLEGSISMREHRTGFGGSMAINLISRPVKLGLSLRGFSKWYANLSSTDSLRIPALEWAVRLGFSLGKAGYLSATYAETNYRHQTDTRRLSLQYQRHLFRGGSLYIRGSRRWESGQENDLVEFGLLVPLGNGHISSVRVKGEEDGTTAVASFHKNPPRGPGTGYRVQVEGEFNSETSLKGNTRLEHHGRNFNLSGEYWKSDSTGTIEINLSGSVVMINGELHLGRPIHEGFALVSTGIQDIKVRLNGQYMGETSRDGTLFLSELTAYSENTISVSAEELPLGYSLTEGVRTVAPYYRSGGVVEFSVKRLRAVEGYLYWIQEDRKTPAEFVGLELTINDKTIQSVTGKDGFFYIEDILSGEYPIRLFKGDRECRTSLKVPESEDLIVNVGEVVCREEKD